MPLPTWKQSLESDKEGAGKAGVDTAGLGKEKSISWDEGWVGTGVLNEVVVRKGEGEESWSVVERSNWAGVCVGSWVSINSKSTI